jgi:maleate isomerase
VNQDIAGYFQSRGLDVINLAGFEIASDADMTMVTQHSIYQGALAACRDDAELLFISCTALRATSVIEALEQQLKRPVITSNQALVWHALELIGKPYIVTGFGSLFTQHLEQAA